MTETWISVQLLKLQPSNKNILRRFLRRNWNKDRDAEEKQIQTVDEDKTFKEEDVQSSFKLRNRVHPRHDSSSVSTRPTKRKRLLDGTDEKLLMKILAEAEYEVEYDAYRGLKLYLNPVDINIVETDRCPWLDCVSSNDSGRHDIDVEGEDQSIGSPTQLVSRVCRCSCPSLIQLTQKVLSDAQRKKNKKRGPAMHSNSADFGSRPSDVNFKCPCDHNMLCLWTLGGVMDEIIMDYHRNVIANDNQTESEVGLKNAQDGKDIDSELYSQTTKQQLQRIRKTNDVSEEKIRRYLLDALQDLASTVSIDECIKKVRNHHNSLIFEFPRSKPIEAPSSPRNRRNLKYAIPPGIENLGATCYLNTQLQCLSQNRVFVDGILSWRTTEPANQGKNIQSDRMTSVITSFQELLARMNEGPYSSLSTIEFSNSLGLDHFEQQDPNEFSRLFFERLHNSFQETSNETKKNGQYDLAGLLPHLFEGIIVYEITCSSCLTKSTTTEKFMDLNLPIVRKSSKVAGQQKIDDILTKAKSDSNVQYCLEQYCIPENLVGDNQYMCSTCRCKRDAKRASFFQKLPPVLNIQLQRYEYDRGKSMKVKSKNKVLLPIELFVRSGKVIDKSDVKDSNDFNVEKTRYVLCAVMRHQGTSAYSGHYIAEAMDWLSGQWFEFNDEKVTLLDGPSCSYIPSSLTTESSKGLSKTNEINVMLADKTKSQPLIGSQDAYNMYYVEESFLAGSILDYFRKGANGASSNIDSSNNVLDSISAERENFFSVLQDLCIEDGKVMTRLEERRCLIRTKVCPNVLKYNRKRRITDFVWVDGNLLRQFFTCQRESFPFTVTKLELSKLRCEHGKLHPRVARQGKLLPLDSCSVPLSPEKYSLNPDQTSGNHGEVMKLVDIAVGADEIICVECENQYAAILGQKIELVRNLQTLFDDLDSKHRPFGLEPDFDETVGKECKTFAYAVSKTFVTGFRNKVNSLLKKMLTIGLNSSSISSQASAIVEGLDGFDLSDFDFASPAALSKELDVETLRFSRVNAPITCVHNNFRPSGQNYRYVNFSTWRTIRSIFPDAIEHKVLRMNSFDLMKKDEDEYNRISYEERFMCSYCKDDDFIKAMLLKLIGYCEQKGMTFESPSYDDVHRISQEPGEFDGKEFKIVHKDDIGKFNTFVATCKIQAKNQSFCLNQLCQDIFVLKQPTEQRSCFFQGHSGVQKNNADTERLGLLSQTFHPFSCLSHRRPVSVSISNAQKACLTQELRVMDKAVYQQFITVIVGIFCLAVPDDDIWVDDIQSLLSKATKFSREWSIDILHPTCTIPPRNISQDVALLLSNGGCTIDIIEPVCKNSVCCTEYLDFCELNLPTSLHNGDKLPNECEKDDTHMMIETIQEDQSFEPSVVTIRVFTTQHGADLQDTLATIESIASPENESVTQSLRRSTRKRKAKYPLGVILDEESVDVNLDKNIATLRLKMMEQCGGQVGFELDHTVYLIVTHGLTSDDVITEKGMSPAEVLLIDKFAAPNYLNLTSDFNQKNLRDEIIGLSCLKVIPQNFIAESVFLVRQPVPDDKASKEAREGLIEYLLRVSDACDTQGDKGRQSKQRKTERGFTGTLLSSSAPTEQLDAPKSCNGNETAFVQDNLAPNQAHSSTMKQNLPMKSIVNLHDDCSLEEDTSSPMEENYFIRQTSISDCHCPDTQMDLRNRHIKANDVNKHSSVESLGINIPDSESDNECEIVFQTLEKATTLNASPQPTQKEIVNAKSGGHDSCGLFSKDMDKSTDLVQHITKMLLSNADLAGKEGACFLAAEKAVEQNPSILLDNVLLDIAYSIYLSDELD